MKKFLLLLAALILTAGVACAEAPTEATPIQAIPAQIVPYEEGLLSMPEAIARAEEAVETLPENRLTHAELVRMTDERLVWVVSIFDHTGFTDAWSIAIEAKDGSVVSQDATTIGYFATVNARWVAAKGNEALWSLEDKLLYDTLYSIQPTYGMPVNGDKTQAEALVSALKALNLSATDLTEGGYAVGYGYIAGSADGEVAGVWEVYLVQEDELVYKVNLNAVTGEIYLIEPDEEGNG